MRKLLLYFNVLLLPILFNYPLFAQDEQALASLGEENLYDLSLEELMNIPIVSASQEKETLFEAPVSSYSITKEEISKSGVSSIPEALRLAPGVIVRETTNGNYDIHLRGMDNPVRYTETAFQINVLTLVMIDNMPVFSNGQGGTYWEGLPVDLVDVERIEIVRGPAAALFGPNAVTGVINIITKDFKGDSNDWYVSANAQYGQPNTSIGNVAVGKSFGEKLNVAISGNYQERERHDDKYYRYYFNDYMSSEEFRRSEDIDHEMALNKKGVNAYLNYDLNENINFNLSGGISQGNAQKVHFLDSIPLTHSEMKTNYLSFSTKVHGFNARVSSMWKEENLLDREAALTSSTYNLNNFDAVLDYQLKISDRISIRPSLNIMQSTFDDLEFKEEKGAALLNMKESINSMGASLRADINPVDNLRLVASVRGDKFNVKDDLVYSYQFLTTYNFNDRWLVRAVHSNSKSGLYYSHSFTNMEYSFPDPDGNNWTYKTSSNPDDFEPVSNTMTEFGVRGKISNNFQLDLTLFTQKLTNLSELLYDPVRSDPMNFTIHSAQLNLPFELKQNGATLSINYIPSHKLQFKPFVTVQKSEMENFYNLRDFMIDPLNPPYETSEHKSTPSFYGGFFANYMPVNKLNINISGYFFGDQTMYHAQDATPMFETKENEISSKILANTKISYEVFDKLKAYIGGKNLLNQNSREYYGTDRIGTSYYIGVGYNF